MKKEIKKPTMFELLVYCQDECQKAWFRLQATIAINKIQLAIPEKCEGGQPKQSSLIENYV